MKRFFLIIVAVFLACNSCFAAEGISFIYINGSNNNDTKMKNWYENGVKNLHPVLKQQFEKSTLANQYFLKNGEYYIEKEPRIFFWGDESHDDLSFLDNNIAILKGISPWAAYQARSLIAHYLHDAIWVQKSYNMSSVLENLHKMIKKEIESGHKVVLFGYSAGSFVTYEYLSTRLPYISVLDFFNKTNLPQEAKDFVAQHPMKDTCMVAFGSSKLAVMSSTGHVVTNANMEEFKRNYLNLNNYTDTVCAPTEGVKGIVNFASPLVLFYSDISDPNFELTYYNTLLYKYIIEKDLFWLTVNYREDPLGFPTTRNLTIEELENYAQIQIEPHSGFIYDWSVTPSGRTFIGAHTAYWSTKNRFSKAIVTAYDNGYRHQYDKEFQKRALKSYVKKFPVPKIPIPQIPAALQKLP